MKRWNRAFGAAASLVLSALLSAGAAQARDGSAGAAPEDGLVGDSYLVTPEEMRRLDLPSSEISAQQALWDALPPPVYHEQMARNEAARVEAAAAFGRLIRPAKPGGMTTMTTPETCNSGSFTVPVSGVGTFCYGAGPGTYILTTSPTAYGADGVCVRAGAHKGRIMYNHGGTYKWSNTRGPSDYTMRCLGANAGVDYDDWVTLTRVQLYDPPF